MAIAVGSRGQQTRDIMFVVSGQLTSSSPTQLVLPEHRSRSYFLLENLSGNTIYIAFGAGEAKATISGGVVTSISVTNGGFGFTVPPQVLLLGGGVDGNTKFVGATSPGYPPPGVSYNNDMPPIGRQAVAHAVLSGGVVTSIVVDDGGAGYALAPFVLMINDPNDPNGCADPSVNSGYGIPITTNGSFQFAGNTCTTSPVAIYCGTSGARFCCKFMQ